ncbi:aminotransferase class V-fold PLP-dependent enzyme [Dactylosporangium roseum]|uniref:Aminotransferase class V-fold PLP-dependent enzyme n=1 Tax=Dactylosporangium roseum TaxID=47989 RepID=A0ABY5YXB9_9ACTN|nr:aminotransferase class V-fold PLP-dependent enzyme [Dactylosporangium roseum]
MDYNATAPIDPRIADAMVPCLTTWFGNPSSGHPYADRPRGALQQARAQVAALVGARPDEVVFTSSGWMRSFQECAGSVEAHAVTVSA